MSSELASNSSEGTEDSVPIHNSGSSPVVSPKKRKSSDSSSTSSSSNQSNTKSHARTIPSKIENRESVEKVVEYEVEYEYEYEEEVVDDVDDPENKAPPLRLKKAKKSKHYNHEIIDDSEEFQSTNEEPSHHGKPENTRESIEKDTEIDKMSSEHSSCCLLL